MNTRPFTSGFQRQANFNTGYPNTSYYQQTASNGATFGAQTAHITTPMQFNTQNKYQLPSQHPGTNQQFSQHPGINPFLTRHPTTTHFAIHHSGTNQYTLQYPGTSQYATQHMGHPGPPRFAGRPPLWGTPQYLANKQPFPETEGFFAPQFQRKTTQVCNETRCASVNTWESTGDKGTAKQCNFQFAKSISSPSQTQPSNAFHFDEPKRAMKSEPEEPRHIAVRKIRRKPVFDNNPSLGQDTGLEAVREQTTEAKQSIEVQRRQTEKDRITNLIRIQHLISSYVKVRNLAVLCRDFKTPVFGDFPEGNEVEKAIMRNLSHFLKDEIKRMRFVDLEERGQLTFDKCVEDPILRASFPVIRTTIMRLELKRDGLDNEKKKIDILEKETKAFSEDLKVKEAEAKTLMSEVGAEKARLEKLSERQTTERKNNEAIRLEFGQEMEEIHQIQIHSLHEGLRALQEKISKEAKLYNLRKEQLQKLNEQNNSLRLRISEEEMKKDNLTRKEVQLGHVGQSTAANSRNKHPSQTLSFSM